MRVSVENQAKSLHAVAYLKSEMFQSFAFTDIDGQAEVRICLCGSAAA